MHSKTPEVIHLAKLINRTPSSIAMRLVNFASIDPFHQKRGIKGLSGGKKQVEPIWNEFIENKGDLIFESERILANKESTSLENKFTEILFWAQRTLKENHDYVKLKCESIRMYLGKLYLPIILVNVLFLILTFQNY